MPLNTLNIEAMMLVEGACFLGEYLGSNIVNYLLKTTGGETEGVSLNWSALIAMEWVMVA